MRLARPCCGLQRRLASGQRGQGMSCGALKHLQLQLQLQLLVLVLVAVQSRLRMQG